MPANKLFSYPHDVFLMIRFEFMVICQDELEAKLLRIIEMHVNDERRRLFNEIVNRSGEQVKADQIIEITKDVWVPISYRLFMNDLYGTVASENTLKRALKSMAKKKLIFCRYNPKKRYDTPEYKLHVPVMQTLLDLIGKPGYQKLIPSMIDTLKNLPPQFLTPSECQKLIPSIDTLSTGRVSKFDTDSNNSNNNESNNKRGSDSNVVVDETSDAHASALPPSFLSEENLIPPQLTLPQKDRKQAMLDEKQRDLLYLSLPKEVQSALIYLSEQKYHKVQLLQSTYDGEDMTLFIVTDPHTGTPKRYRTETFLKFVDEVKQHSAELSKRDIAREIDTILDDALGDQTRFPEPPPQTPLPETKPQDASNSPSVEETPNYTHSSSNGLISASTPQEMALVSEDESASMNSSKRAVSHSQGTLGNGTVSETQNSTLPGMEKPETPVMPPAEMKWGAEKMVQITEALRYVRGKQGAYFSEEIRGKGGKSQRTRQLEAAKKGMALGVTQEEYIRAYVKRNDAWWNENQGSLTIENMFANTPRKQIRILEILEELESKSAAIAPQRQASNRDEVTVGAAQTRQPENSLPLPSKDSQWFKKYEEKMRRNTNG